MDEIFSSYNLKSRITNLACSLKIPDVAIGAPEFRMLILDRAWNLLYNSTLHIDNGSPLDAFLTLMREKYDADVVGVDDFDNKYKVSLPFSSWVVEPVGRGFTITALFAPGNAHSAYSRRGVEETAKFISLFDKNIPLINRYIDECISERLKDAMISDLVASAAKGIISQMKDEGVDIPQVVSLKGGPDRRVVIGFEGSKREVDCPLDHLRSRLIRRFVRKRV